MGLEFSCEACGRRFVPPAGEIMKFCSYCGKPVKLVQTQDPDVIPLAEETPPDAQRPMLTTVEGPTTSEVRVPPVVVPPVVVPPLVSGGPPPLPGEPSAPRRAGEDIEFRPLTPPRARGDAFMPPHPAVDAPASTPPATGSDPETWKVEEPPPAAPPKTEELHLRETDENISLLATRCPNCGQVIPAGAEICTECGYSRRLGRTLTTRVGSPEIPRHRPGSEAPSKRDEPTIAAERAYDAERQRKARIAGGGDTLRLFTGVFFTLVFAGVLMTLPLNYLREPAVFLPWRLPELVDGQFMHASLLLGLFLLVIVPITTVGVRIGIALTGLDSPLYLTFVRVAGTLSAVLLTAGIISAANNVVFKLEPRWFYIALGVEAGLALLVFTWYLQNLRFAGAMALWIYTLVFLTVATFAAGAAYSPLARVAGIESPWIPLIGQWFGGLKLPG